MRSHQNAPGLPNRSAAPRSVVADLAINSMPVEWLDGESWRLPSGKLLAEFALQSGFLAPVVFRAEQFGTGSEGRSSEPSSTSEIRRNLGQPRNKQLDKGVAR